MSYPRVKPRKELDAVEMRYVKNRWWQHLANRWGASVIDVQTMHDDGYHVPVKEKVEGPEAPRPVSQSSEATERMAWAENVKAVVKENGLQMIQFAAFIGLAQGTLSNAFRPDRVLSNFVKRSVDIGVASILKNGAPAAKPRPGTTPAPRAWVDHTRERLMQLDMTVADLADIIRIPKTSLAVMLTPTGHITKTNRQKVELALDCCEKPLHAEGRAA